MLLSQLLSDTKASGFRQDSSIIDEMIAAAHRKSLSFR